MSDPLTNSEVEDVLASIRRLVSDEKRQEPKAVDTTMTDRLVLTPSLRVMDDGSKGAPEPDDSVAKTVSGLADPKEASQEDAATDLESGNGAADSDFALAYLVKQDGTSFVARGGDASVTRAVEDDDAAQDFDFDDESHDGAARDIPENPLSDHDHNAALQIDESASDADQQEWSSVSDGTPDAQHDLGEGLVADDQNDSTDPKDWAQDDAPFAMGNATAYLDGVSDVLAATAAKTLGEKVAALETLVGKGRDNFEPDDTGEGANAGTEPPAMEWKDTDPDIDADTDVFEDEAPYRVDFVEVDEVELEDVPQEAAAQVSSRDDEVLDEEALRDLVSNIVREELQGVLGERITRNVRKLVRREIHRALTAQELE